MCRGMAQSEEAWLPLQTRFVTELARLRIGAGMTKTALAEKMRVHRSLVSHVECLRKRPTMSFAEAADDAFGLDGHFVNLAAQMSSYGVLGWFSKWVEEVEIHAVSIWTWDPMLIPGLLQTEAYARAVFESSQVPRVNVEDRVAARTGRRQILEGPTAPKIWVLIDEGVLYRPIGGKEVLRDQLRFVLEIAEH